LVVRSDHLVGRVVADAGRVVDSPHLRNARRLTQGGI
jgi:hypothetical protein